MNTEKISPENARLFFVPSSRHLKKIGCAIIILIIVGVLFSDSELGKTLEFQTARRLEFAVREMMGQSPKLDSRIRIFAFDDKAVSAFNSPDIALSDWTSMLRSIRQRKPKVIVIDKIFGVLPATDAPALSDFISEISQHRNLAMGSWLHASQIPLKIPLDISRDIFSISETVFQNSSLNKWLPERKLNVYGPQEKIAESVKIGQIEGKQPGYAYPWVRIHENKAIPHIAFYASDTFSIGAEAPLIDGKTLPLNRFGLLPVNYSTSKNYYSNLLTMRSLIQLARKGQEISDIQEGDIVLLLPAMFTGNTDFTDSPVGRIPGGFVHASIANSILTGKWLTPVWESKIVIVTFALLGVMIGALISPLVFWQGFLAILFFFIAGSLGAFAFAGVIVSWLVPSILFVVSALSTHALVSFESWNKTLRISHALTGLVSKNKLNELINGSTQIAKEPKEAVVTVMFLDVANFSTTARQLQPKEVFYHLKDIMSRFTSLIHKHGGTVDRTLGDGLLCFFGYSYDGLIKDRHADAAIACAKEIQRENVLHCINSRNGAPVWPIRIGINTASAFIGDLGNEDRIDFTLIGSGVNLAQRLEAACAHHSVMISRTTFDFSNLGSQIDRDYYPCKIKIKNEKELLECIEIDPLADMKPQRAEAAKVLFSYLGLTRSEERWPVIGKSTLDFHSPHGAATIVDFSRSGVCLALPNYLAKGVSIVFEVNSSSALIQEKLKNERLQKFRTEVRWGRPKDDQYLHGFLFADLNEGQQQIFFDLLRESCSTFAQQS